MKLTMKLLTLFFGVLMLANAAHAQSPREQLQQMVEQLQKTPSDNALREKIIKLAPTLKPSPAIPDTAVTYEGRAQFAFKSAKSEGDYLAAAQEYEKAVVAAPWVPGYYSDLCTIYEKAGKFEDAKRHCGFYLSGLTDPAQITDVKRRIAGLEFGIEKANSPEARAAKQKAKDEELMKSLEGAVFTNNIGPGLYEDQWRVSGGHVVNWNRRLMPRGCLCNEDNRCSGLIGEEGMCSISLTLNGRRGERRESNGKRAIEIAEDGRSLIMRWLGNLGTTSEDIYMRR